MFKRLGMIILLIMLGEGQADACRHCMACSNSINKCLNDCHSGSAFFLLENDPNCGHSFLNNHCGIRSYDEAKQAQPSDKQCSALINAALQMYEGLTAMGRCSEGNCDFFFPDWNHETGWKKTLYGTVEAGALILATGAAVHTR